MENCAGRVMGLCWRGRKLGLIRVEVVVAMGGSSGSGGSKRRLCNSVAKHDFQHLLLLRPGATALIPRVLLLSSSSVCSPPTNTATSSSRAFFTDTHSRVSSNKGRNGNGNTAADAIDGLSTSWLKESKSSSSSSNSIPGNSNISNNYYYKRRKKPQDFDAFGTWDSTMDLPLKVDASIAQGKPIPEVLAGSIGLSSVKGRRPYQEDRASVEQINPSLLYWAVFDGHGGSACSHFCAQQMPRHVAHWIDIKAKENEGTPAHELDLSTVLYNAFLAVNNSFARWAALNRKDSLEGDSSGTTATVVLLKDSTTLAVAHVGDSRAILCRGGEARKLTTDHVPSLLTEKIRIERSGGRVSGTRVNERLAMTRSIGDLELKRFGVIAEPEIRIMDISHSRDAFIVLTTDGINNVMTDNEIIETVKQAEDPTVAAHLLTDTAVQYSSEDNTTAIVTPLGAWGKYSAAATIFHSFGKSFTSSSRFS